MAIGRFQVPSQPWLLVNRTPTYLIEGSCAGSMGLAFESLAWTGAVPFWQTLADSGQLTTPEMSFWFTRYVGDANAQEEEFGGTFTLGGRNQTLYTGDVEFLPLVTNAGRKTYWLLGLSRAYLICPRLVSGSSSHTPASLTEITVNKKNVTLPPGNVAAIATGTTLVAGPPAAVSAVYAQIPGSLPLSGKYAGYYGFRTFVFLLVKSRVDIPPS